MEGKTKIRLRGTTTRTAILAIAIGFAIVLAAVAVYSATAALLQSPEALECIIDTDGANDEPGQKDLTQLCRETTAIDPVEITWNWDITNLGGLGNTADACALFDTDNDGLANYSVCKAWYDGQL